MKRNGNIVSLFQKHVAKKAANIAPSPSSNPDVNVVEDQPQEQERVIEENVDHTPPPAPAYDVDRLPHDPGERLSIQSYHVNDQDAIRRSYILKGPVQPYAHEFPKRTIGKRERQFNYVWFHKHHWLEFSIKKDYVFCFVYMLFV